MRPARVAVVIVTWRSAALAIECLHSLQAGRAADPDLFHVFVVDNDSGDFAPVSATVQRQGWQHWVTVIASPCNGGFAAGNNLGFAHAQACQPDYLHMLNPDTRVDAATIAALVAVLDQHPGVGIAGSAFANGDGSDWPLAFRFPSALSELEGGVGFGPLSWCLRSHTVARVMSGAVTAVDWGAGASMMVRQALVDQIGGLDEQFFLYFEETEFCWRARQAGAAMWYVPASRVVHIAGQSTQLTARGAALRRLPAYWFESRRRYFLLTAGLAGAIGIDLVALFAALAGHVKRTLLGQRAAGVPCYARDLLHFSVLWPANRTLAPARTRLPRLAMMSLRDAAGALPARPVPASAPLGIVVIGRNEGVRLQHCLASLTGWTQRLVYVDSGSCDGSCALARDACCTVVELPATQPFTAARARNAGFRRLFELHPQLSYVLFVDGDCMLDPGWPTLAVQHLTTHPQVAVVCGRRREQFPGQSAYNLLCDIEWDGPTGLIGTCGGDAVMRRDALEAAGGFRAELICGEEPELCLRLRRAGWQICRLGAPMTLHDADMHRFRQWWLRNVRGGFACAQACWLHGRVPPHEGVRESLSIWGWALLAPLALLGSLPGAGHASWLWLLLYPVQMLRIAGRGQRPWRQRACHAFFLVLGKFPQGQGQLQFMAQGLRRVRAGLIEYK